MFINEAITRYMEETAEKRRRAKELEEFTRPQWGKPCKTPLKDIEAAAAELEPLNIELKIRHDNTRRMIYNATIPAVLDILKKWNGKPYGEKTKQKICDEMKTRFNCALYLSNTYGGKIDLVPLNGEGYTNYTFKYDEFDIYTRYKDGQQIHVLNDNRINGAITADDIYLSNCPAIVADPAARAAEILAAFTELKRKQDQFEREITQFNNLLPSGIERRHISGFRNYL
jgi:hypothetical protein